MQNKENETENIFSDEAVGGFDALLNGDDEPIDAEEIVEEDKSKEAENPNDDDFVHMETPKRGIEQEDENQLDEDESKKEPSKNKAGMLKIIVPVFIGIGVITFFFLSFSAPQNAGGETTSAPTPLVYEDTSPEEEQQGLEARYGLTDNNESKQSENTIMPYQEGKEATPQSLHGEGLIKEDSRHIVGISEEEPVKLSTAEKELYGVAKNEVFEEVKGGVCSLSVKYKPDAEYVYYVIDTRTGEYIPVSETKKWDKKGVKVSSRNVVEGFDTLNKFVEIEANKFLPSEMFSECKPITGN